MQLSTNLYNNTKTRLLLGKQQGIHSYTPNRRVKKSNPLRNIALNFVVSQLILKILSLLERVLHLQQKPCNGSHHTLNMSLYYLGSEKSSYLLQTAQTKCINSTCTHFNRSCLLTYFLLTYYEVYGSC